MSGSETDNDALPICMETPEDSEMEEVYLKRGYDHELEKRQSNKSYNSVIGMVDDHRLKSTAWCSCGNCKLFNQPRECCCCQEYLKEQNELAEKLKDQCEEGKCVATSDPVNWALEPKGVEYDVSQMSEKKNKIFDECTDDNKRRRHISYRKITYALWGRRMYQERIVLPACIVARVLATYPPTSGLRTGYTSAMEKEDEK